MRENKEGEIRMRRMDGKAIGWKEVLPNIGDGPEDARHQRETACVRRSGERDYTGYAVFQQPIERLYINKEVENNKS